MQSAPAMFIFLIIIASVTCISATNNTGAILSISKRELNWDSKTSQIVSRDTNDRKLVIKYLKSHPDNDKVEADKKYLAFNLYQINGKWPRGWKNTGIFHFVHDKKLNIDKSECRPTPHAAAYYHFYENCTKDETDLVASGYCYKGNELIFKSGTFNFVTGKPYLAGQYYVTKNPEKRGMDLHEQRLVENCYQLWNDSGFLTTFRCNLDVAGRPRRDAEMNEQDFDGFRRYKRDAATEDCCYCNRPVSGSRVLLPSCLAWHGLSLLSAFVILEN